MIGVELGWGGVFDLRCSCQMMELATCIDMSSYIPGIHTALEVFRQ